MEEPSAQNEPPTPQDMTIQQPEAQTTYTQLESMLENSRLLGAETLSSLYCQREVWTSAGDRLDEMAEGLRAGRRQLERTLSSSGAWCCWPRLQAGRRDDFEGHPGGMLRGADKKGPSVAMSLQVWRESSRSNFVIEDGEDLSLHDDVNLQIKEPPAAEVEGPTVISVTAESITQAHSQWRLPAPSSSLPSHMPSAPDPVNHGQRSETAASSSGQEGGTQLIVAADHTAHGEEVQLPSDAIQRQVEELGKMALVLGEELELQGGMLEELHDKTENTKYQLVQQRKAISNIL